MFGKGIEFELIVKAWAYKKNSSYRFSQFFAKKRLSQTYISLCLVALPQGGKTKHHCGNTRNKCQAATS
jgi:hypothetical protein